MIARYAAEAETEIEAARSFYDEQRSGLGDAFQRAVVATIARALDAPRASPVVRPERQIRRAVVRGFPYVIVFAVVETTLFVLAVAHTRRRPAYWANRR